MADLLSPFPIAPSTRHITSSDRLLIPKLLSLTHSFVQISMSKYDSSHDFSHVLRVLHLSLHIASAEQKRLTGKSSPGAGESAVYDRTIVSLAALLHDIGDQKYKKDGEGDGDREEVKRFLVEEGGASEVLGNTIQTIVSAVSYSKEVKDPARVKEVIGEYPELAVVQDADRLDAIGAVGIGRTFTYAGAKGTGGPGMENVLKHFEEKLLRLGALMKTQTGKEMAEKRLKLLREFEKNWISEKSEAGGVEVALE